MTRLPETACIALSLPILTGPCSLLLGLDRLFHPCSSLHAESNQQSQCEHLSTRRTCSPPDGRSVHPPSKVPLSSQRFLVKAPSDIGQLVFFFDFHRSSFLLGHIAPMTSNSRRTAFRPPNDEPSYPYATTSRQSQGHQSNTTLANCNRYGIFSGSRSVDTGFSDARQNSLDSNRTLLDAHNPRRSSQTTTNRYMLDYDDYKNDTLLHPLLSGHSYGTGHQSELQKSQCAQSGNWLTIDPDDPRLTVPLDELLRDEDMDMTTKELDERRRLLKMSEKHKRKERRRLKIVKHVTCMLTALHISHTRSNSTHYGPIWYFGIFQPKSIDSGSS